MIDVLRLRILWLSLPLLTACTATTEKAAPLTSEPQIVAREASAHDVTPADPADLLGVWEVDLRYRPGAKDNWQQLVVADWQARALSGSFHGSPILRGHGNEVWGDLHLAVVTDDGAGEYVTSGVLDGERLDGLTYAVQRGFLAPWRGGRTRSRASTAGVTVEASADLDALLGRWEVDLRSEPAAEPYLIPFVLERDAAGELIGSFYGSTLENVQVNVAWGAAHVAFTTHDGNGVRYVTFATLHGEEVRGRTLAVERGFLSPWTALRSD